MRLERFFIEPPRPSCISNKVRCTRLVISAVLLCAGVCTATAATTLTLADAVVRAFDHAPRARIARLETARAEGEVSVTEGSYWPIVGASSRAGWSNRMDETIEAVDGNGHLQEYPSSSLGSQEGWFNLFVRQLLFDLGKWRLIEQAAIEAEAARVSEAQAREAIALDVLSRYADVLRAERLRDAQAEAVKSAEWLDGQAQLLLVAGRCLPGQRDEVGVHLESTRLDADLRRAEVMSGREALILAIGDSDLVAQALVLDAVSLAAVREQPDADQAAAAVEESPEIRILGARLHAEEVRVAAARAERFPTVGLVAGYTHYGAKRYDSYVDEMHAGIDIKMSIFDGFRNAHSVGQALDDLEIARIRQQSVLESKRTGARNLARRLAAAQQRAKLAHRQEVLSAERLKLADLNLRAQRGDLDAALAARTACARETQLAVDADYEVIRLWATLEHETGRLARAIVGEPETDGAKPAP
jgi:outer membrane protein TolC